MVKTASTMLDLGTEAPDFALPDVDGTIVTRDAAAGEKGLLVVFMCNHCPFVIHLRDELVAFADEYLARGLGVVGISSNDITTHPDDSPERMREFAKKHGVAFPYLYDESQAVARAYKAACTPDFFLFDARLELAYRGQFDDSRPGNGKDIDGADLRAACDRVLAGEEVPPDQKPGIGCNIKWKPGNEPPYFTGVSAE